MLAVGDSDNDIPVLEAAGYAVAMGGSTEGVMAVADWQAPSVEEDGAAVAMRKFVLEPMGSGVGEGRVDAGSSPA